jgi:2-polyprenyl-3-methyl-5-hydroxy-6-metoxy-1,4-benzoquinol methylase
MSSGNMLEHRQRLNESRQLWDDAAPAFDDEPDHGLRDPVVRAAWTALLQQILPVGGTLLDIGCGTGSLSLILAELGYTVSGIDWSPAMLERAQAKAQASNRAIHFQVMDAAFPQFPPGQFDAIMCRHLLWALPQPDQVLVRWVNLLKPGGRLFLVEGYWHTSAGLHAPDVVAALPASLTNVIVRNLSAQADLWGSPCTDERYAITADVKR